MRDVASKVCHGLQCKDLVKRDYKGKLERKQALKISESHGRASNLWLITNESMLVWTDGPNLPDESNNFCCWCETKNNSEPFAVNPSEPSALPFLIREHEVKKKKKKTCCGSKTVERQLAWIKYHLLAWNTAHMKWPWEIFNCSLAQQKVPKYFKSACAWTWSSNISHKENIWTAGL